MECDIFVNIRIKLNKNVHYSEYEHGKLSDLDGAELTLVKSLGHGWCDCKTEEGHKVKVSPVDVDKLIHHALDEYGNEL